MTHDRHLKLDGNASAADIARFKGWHDADKYTMVWYHADWCGHCKDMKAEWGPFVSDALAKHGNLYIVDMMNTEMSRAGMDHEAEVGFPTIKMYYRGALKKEFEGARDKNSFMRFVTDNCAKTGGYRRKARASTRSRRQTGGAVAPSRRRRRALCCGSTRHSGGQRRRGRTRRRSGT